MRPHTHPKLRRNTDLVISGAYVKHLKKIDYNFITFTKNVLTPKIRHGKIEILRNV